MSELIALETLPIEILLNIYSYLKVNEALRLSLTCKRLSLITQEEFFWQDVIKKEFGIDLRQAKTRPIPAKLFYQKVLHKYGRFLGLWQRLTLGHYGSLIQVMLILSNNLNFE